MFIYINGECWTKPRIFNAPTRQYLNLTDAEIANVPWDLVRLSLVRLSYRIGVDEGRPIGYFSFPFMDLSPRLLNVSCLVMYKSDSMMAFAEGTHARLGAASPVLALVRAPELLGMIERFAM